MADKEPEVSKLKAVLASAGRIAKKGLRAGIISAAILLPTCGLANMAGKWVYQIKTNYGAVITEWNGERIAVSEPGWHSRVPLLSTYESQYALANQMIFLHGKSHPHEVITKGGDPKEGTVIMAAATTFYEIVDLKQYAIENIRADTATIQIDDANSSLQRAVPIEITPGLMIQRTLDSIIGEQIQKRDPTEIIHNRRKVEEEILETIVKSDVSLMYGIKINGFRFTETSYIPQVVLANASKQAAVAQAEGEYAAAQIKKKSIETLAQADGENYRILEKALDPKNAEERRLAQEIFQSLVKYRTLRERSGDTVWLVPESTPPLPTYRPK